MTFNKEIVKDYVRHVGQAVQFFFEVIGYIMRGRIRFHEVVKQVYEQGLQSLLIIALTSLASGLVLAMQSYVVLVRFGAKEFIASLVVLSLVRELSPVFTALIFSGKAGSRMTAELGTMNVNEQMLATRAMGIDPIELFIVPRMLACFLVVPILTVFSEIIGIMGGYMIGVWQAQVPGAFYINQTIKSVHYVDFFSGFIKVFFFAIIISWVCCYQGYVTKEGSLGVGKYTTKAVAYSYIFVIVSNTLLTKIILTFWG
jgi:phospholipid/cholesterol/gamma-HCH transport system permease protein